MALKEEVQFDHLKFCLPHDVRVCNKNRRILEEVELWIHISSKSGVSVHVYISITCVAGIHWLHAIIYYISHKRLMCSG